MSNVPGSAHLVAQWHLGVALYSDLFPGFAPGARPRIDRHGRIHEAGEDDVGTDAVRRILHGDLLRQRDHRRLDLCLVDRVNPALRRAVAITDELRERHFRAMTQAAVEAEGQARWAMWVVASIALGALLLSSCIAVALTRRGW